MYSTQGRTKSQEGSPLLLLLLSPLLYLLSFLLPLLPPFLPSSSSSLFPNSPTPFPLHIFFLHPPSMISTWEMSGWGSSIYSKHMTCGVDAIGKCLSHVPAVHTGHSCSSPSWLESVHKCAVAPTSETAAQVCTSQDTAPIFQTRP